MNEEKLYKRLQKLIRLKKTERIGAVAINKLIDKYGSIEEIDLDNIDVKDSLFGNSKQNFDGFAIVEDNEIEIQIKRMKSAEARLICRGDIDYPEELMNFAQSPPYFFIRGSLVSQDRNAVAIVGTRRVTSYGRNATKKLATELARKGITIVSGFADGVDTIAHRSAIDAKGRTIAVLGCGVDIVYPPSNSKLWHEFPEHGAIISEFMMGASPAAYHFPQRNRIISALSMGVLVVEAGTKSGSLITANYALEQNKEVFAIPGDIFNKSSTGTNQLIQKGAKLVTNANDVVDELGLSVPDSESTILMVDRTKELSGTQKDIYEVLTLKPIAIDEIAKKLDVSVNELLSELTVLELRGFVRQHAGKQFVRSI
jgi:DNA processing protein